MFGHIAQLARALASHARGQWFKSTYAHCIFEVRCSLFETRNSSIDHQYVSRPSMCFRSPRANRGANNEQRITKNMFYVEH